MGGNQSTRATQRSDSSSTATKKDLKTTVSSCYVTERQRNPYSYARNELQNSIPSQPPPQPANLYPDLSSQAQPRHFSFETRDNSNFSQPKINNDTNRKFVAAEFTPLNRPHDIYQPSAPPAPAKPEPTKHTRSKSVPRDRNTSENASITCGTCNNTYGEKIYNCVSGHSSCGECKRRGLRCGVCRAALTDVRNMAMEEYVAERQIKCPHAGDGCGLFFKKSEMDKHAQECPFKEMQCPITGNCNWRGKLPQLSSHFTDCHPNNMAAALDTEMTLPNISREHRSTHLVVLGVFHFLFNVKVSQAERKIYMAIQLIGTNMSAAKWKYEIHLYNKMEPRRKYKYEDTCRSSNESIVDILNNKCAVIPLQHASTFADRERLTYKIYVTREAKREFYNRRGRGGRRR